MVDGVNSVVDEYPSGTVIAEGFRVLSYLAQGGMAKVYVGEQISVKRVVALKVLSHEFSHNEGVVQRFRREGILLCQLAHPNTVKVHDMGMTIDNRLFIAMELLKGESLGKRIEREGRLSADKAIPIVIQVAQSLSEAHALGVIHRDLKPDNVYLTTVPVDFVKVLDFGIAKIRDDSEEAGKKLTRQGTAPGTPEYMSPEQARGQELDGRSDLYSLGVVLYEMLAGSPPFSESTFLATILMHVQAAPPPLPETVPIDLRNYIINRLMAKDKNCRPPDAITFVQEITELARKARIRGFFSEEAGQKQVELNQAKAEIEKLKSQLAQTQAVLMRSMDSPVVDPDMAPPGVSMPSLGKPASSPPAGGPIGLSRPQNRMQAPLGSHTLNRTQSSPPHVAQGPMAAPLPQGPQRQRPGSGPQNAEARGLQPKAAPRPEPVDWTEHEASRSPAPQRRGAYTEQSPQQGAYPEPQVVSYPALKPVQGIEPNFEPNPRQDSRQNLKFRKTEPHREPQSDSRSWPEYEDEFNEPIVAPAPRYTQESQQTAAVPPNIAPTPHSARTPQSTQSSQRAAVRSTREDDTLSPDEQRGQLSRPKDPLSGKARNSLGSLDKQGIFMSYAQPVIQLMGQARTKDALFLAMGVWNAAVRGVDPMEDLADICEGRPDFAKFFKTMIEHKTKYFAQHRWTIEGLRVNIDPQGRLEISFHT